MRVAVAATNPAILKPAGCSVLDDDSSTCHAGGGSSTGADSVAASSIGRGDSQRKSSSSTVASSSLAASSNAGDSRISSSSSATSSCGLNTGASNDISSSITGASSSSSRSSSVSLDNSMAGSSTNDGNNASCRTSWVSRGASAVPFFFGATAAGMKLSLEATALLGAIAEEDKDESPLSRATCGLGLLAQGISAATVADRRAVLAERGELLLQVLLLLARAAVAERNKQQQSEGLKDGVGRSWGMIYHCLEEIIGLRTDIMEHHARE